MLLFLIICCVNEETYILINYVLNVWITANFQWNVFYFMNLIICSKKEVHGSIREIQTKSVKHHYISIRVKMYRSNNSNDDEIMEYRYSHFVKCKKQFWEKILINCKFKHANIQQFRYLYPSYIHSRNLAHVLWKLCIMFIHIRMIKHIVLYSYNVILI